MPQGFWPPPHSGFILSDFTSVHVSPSFSEGNYLGATSPERADILLSWQFRFQKYFHQRVCCLWPSLQIPHSPTHFYSLGLAGTFHHHPLQSLPGSQTWHFPVQTETCWVCDANHTPRVSRPLIVMEVTLRTREIKVGDLDEGLASRTFSWKSSKSKVQDETFDSFISKL